MNENANNSLRKKISPFTVFIISLILVIVVSASIAIVTNNVKASSTIGLNKNISTQVADANIDNSSNNTTYYVKEYEGRIAVFKDINNKPITITDTYVFTFPKEDKELLCKGVKVEGEKKLKRFLEDYCS